PERARESLPAGGRSDVPISRVDLRRERARHCAHGHGRRWQTWLSGDRGERRESSCAKPRRDRGGGDAGGCGGSWSRVSDLAPQGHRRARVQAHAGRRRCRVIAPEDYEFLSALLKRRSGLTLGDGKAYLLESRLPAVASVYNLTDIPALVRALRA